MNTDQKNNVLDVASRFVATDMSKAMRKLSDAFGADALILSTRTTANGVEVLGAPAHAYGEALTLDELRKRKNSLRRQSSSAMDAVERRSPAHGMRKRRLGQTAGANRSGGNHALKHGSLEFVASNAAEQLGLETKPFQEVSLDKLYARVAPEEQDETPRYENPLRPLAEAEELDSTDAEKGEASEFADKFSEAFDWEYETGDENPDSELQAKSEQVLPATEQESFNQTASDLLDAVVASEQIQDLKREIEELKRDIQQRLTERSAAKPAGGNRIKEEMLGYGLSETVVSNVLKIAALDIQQAGTAEEKSVAALRALKGYLPVARVGVLQREGIVAVTGGVRNDQEATLIKLALYFAQLKSTDAVAIISVGGASTDVKRMALLTGIKVLDCHVGDLREKVKCCARFPHLLIDVGSSLLAADQKGVLAALRALNIGHKEFISVRADQAEPAMREHIARWRSTSTVAALVGGLAPTEVNMGGLLSVMLEEQIPVAGWVEEALLPESVQHWSRERLMAELSAVEKTAAHGTIPVVC